MDPESRQNAVSPENERFLQYVSGCPLTAEKQLATAAGDILAERGQAKAWEARNLSAATAGHHADSELGELVLLQRVVAAAVGDRERPAVAGDRGVGLAARQLVPEGIGKSNARKGGGGGGRDAGRGMEGGIERVEKER